MNYTKPFKTFVEQVDTLKTRGILFDKITEQEAGEKLTHINYYKMSAYIKYFEVPQEKDTYKNIDFKEVLDLYYFDKKLRGLIFSAIEEIEISLKTSLAHYISEYTKSCGALGYTNISTWIDMKQKNSEEIIILQDEFSCKWIKTIKDSNYQFIKNYLLKYNKEKFVPLWMLAEIIDFGAAVRLYELSCNDIKQKISSIYGITSNDMIYYLRAIKLIRNFCAHNSKVWNIKLHHHIKWKTRGKLKIDNLKIIAVILLLRKFIKKINQNNDFSEIKSCLLEHFEKYPNQIKDIGVLDGKLSTLESLF
ncbi:MAG: Abi family protein [Fusobacteriaceae bacterium]